MLAAAAFGLLTVATVLVHRRRKRRAPQRLLAGLRALGYGATLHQPSVVDGAGLRRPDGIDVDVWISGFQAPGSRSPVLIVTASRPDLPPTTFTVIPRAASIPGRIAWSPPNAAHVAIGDQAFDDTWIVRGDPACARAALSSTARGRLAALGPRASLHEGTVELSVASADTSPDELARLIDASAAVAAELLVPPHDVPDRLARTIAAESCLLAQTRQIASLLSQHAGTPAARRVASQVLEHPNELVCALAHAHMGPAGLHVVDRTLAISPNPAVRRLVALALALYEPAIAAPRAARALADGVLEVAAAAAHILSVRPGPGTSDALFDALRRMADTPARESVHLALDACPDDLTAAALDRVHHAASVREAVTLIAVALARADATTMPALAAIADDRRLEGYVRQAAADAQRALRVHLANTATPGALAVADLDGGSLALVDPPS